MRTVVAVPLKMDVSLMKKGKSKCRLKVNRRISQPTIGGWSK
jgi:hypothetical protein